MDTALIKYCISNSYSPHLNINIGLSKAKGKGLYYDSHLLSALQ